MKLLVSLSAGSSLLLSLLEKVHSNVQRNRSSKALQSGLNSRYSRRNIKVKFLVPTHLLLPDDCRHSLRLNLR